MKEEIKTLLFDEANGICFRLREGDCSIREWEKASLLEFAERVNGQVKRNQIEADDFAVIFELMWFLHEYSGEAAWIEELLSDIYDTVMTDVVPDQER